MFRELIRKNQRLSNKEAVCILKNEKRGVLSVQGDKGYPYGMPMNHFYNEADGCIYFHSGKNGHRLDSIKRDDRVSFCVYDNGTAEEGEWALNINSVIVFGRVEVIDELDKVIEISKKLSYKFTNDEEYINKEIENYSKNTILLRLIPENICGKRVKEA